jgi:hypothetical protein
MQTSVYTANKRAPKNQTVQRFLKRGRGGKTFFKKFFPRKKKETKKKGIRIWKSPNFVSMP